MDWGYRMLFDKFETEEIITWLTFDLMKRKEIFMMILGDEPHILSKKEYHDWTKTYELVGEQEVVLFGKQNEGYVIHYNRSTKDVLIPFDLLNLKYDEFLKIELVS